MRERLVAAFVGLTVVVVALYGIPRAYYLADLVRSDEQTRVDRTADVLALLLDERVSSGDAVTAAYLDSLTAAGERIEVTGLPVGDVASADSPGESGGEIRATRSLTAGGRVTVARSGSAVGQEIAGALLPLLVLGLGLALLAALAGLLLAGRLARPFRDLAEVARGLGGGRFHPEIRPYRVPEARAIGDALADAGRQLDQLLEQEREVAVHASHELRTPVTALRLELEDLALWPETPPSVGAELDRCVTELDRLSGAITDLLDLSRTRRTDAEVDVDLDALVAHAAARLGDARRRVDHRPGAPAPTRLDPRPVVRALELLVEEARARGARHVRLTVVPHSAHYEVRLSGAPTDARRAASPGAPARVLDQAGPWSRASDLAAAAGGQIGQDGATLVLRLPRRGLTGTGGSDDPGTPLA